MEFPVLYEKSKTGKTKRWEIKVTEDSGKTFIVRSSGYVGCKQVTSEREVTSGKNLGKKNETSKLQQAILEARSAWDKQKRMGYGEEPEACVQKLLPMLAVDGSKSAHWKEAPELLCQPKIDGIRLLVGFDEEQLQPVCLSRTGIAVDIPHVSNACMVYLRSGLYLDGELHSERMTFEDLSGLFRTQQRTPGQDSQLATCTFHIFDCYDETAPDRPFRERLALLRGHRFVAPLALVNTEPVSPASVEPHMCRMVERGHEGVVLRLPDAPYEVGKRSQSLVKLKPFMDGEFQITGAFAGQGTEADCVVWKCRTPEGKEFHVRPRGSLEERRRQLADHKRFIGKMLTVRYQNLTTDGLPRFPIGVAIRESY